MSDKNTITAAVTQDQDIRNKVGILCQRYRQYKDLEKEVELLKQEVIGHFKLTEPAPTEDKDENGNLLTTMWDFNSWLVSPGGTIYLAKTADTVLWLVDEDVRKAESKRYMKELRDKEWWEPKPCDPHIRFNHTVTSDKGLGQALITGYPGLLSPKPAGK